MSYDFRSPVQPGDRLWWAHEAAADSRGPSLVQARQSQYGIRAVLFDKTGLLVITNEGHTEALNGQYTCVDENACMNWIRASRPDSILMDGRKISAWYVGPDGNGRQLSLACECHIVESILGSPSLASMEPDDTGHFAIYCKNAQENGAPITTFIKNRAGKPVDAIYGPFLLVRMSDEANSDGFRTLTDLSDEVLDAIRQNQAAQADPGSVPRFDPEYWTKASRMTVAMLKEWLDRLPEDAVMHCCGTDLAYLHYAPGNKALSIDCEPLGELPEYEDREPALVQGPEG